MDEREFKEKTKTLVLDVIRLTRSLPANPTAEEIGKQLVRAANAVGANYRATCRARSDADTIASLNLMVESADECLYWMELLVEAELIPATEVRAAIAQVNEVVAIAVASIQNRRNHTSLLFDSSHIQIPKFHIRNRMTPLSIILSFFPAFVIAIAAASFLWMCSSPGIIRILVFLFSLYGLPLLVYRIHKHFYPLKEGISYLRRPAYSPWWGSHQIQAIYIAFPVLESLLRLIPGAFSLWLRLWGAKVGRGVNWMPNFEIADRGLIEIGDRVVMGHRVGIYSHVIKPKNDDLLLYVKTVKIGHEVFIGSGSRLGPGVGIAHGTYIPVTTDLFPNTKVDRHTHFSKFSHH